MGELIRSPLTAWNPLPEPGFARREAQHAANQ